MRAYSQQTYSRPPFAIPSGIVIQFAGIHGCYYSEISVHTFALAEGLVLHQADRYRHKFSSHALSAAGQVTVAL